LGKRKAKDAGEVAQKSCQRRLKSRSKRNQKETGKVTGEGRWQKSGGRQWRTVEALGGRIFMRCVAERGGFDETDLGGSCTVVSQGF
jgi:hypothetical protein